MAGSSRSVANGVYARATIALALFVLSAAAGAATYGSYGTYGTVGDPADSVIDAGDRDTPHGGTAGSPPTGDGVVSVQARNRSSKPETEVPVTFGQVFARGDIEANESVRAVVDGHSIATQVDAKARWPDGSLRHAVITVRVPRLAAGARVDIGLRAVSKSAPAQAITLNQLLSSGFDGEFEIVIDGRRYRADIAAQLRRAADSGNCGRWSKQCKHWLSGPLASEWIVGATLEPADGQTSRLGVYFNVRAYADGNGNVDRARVDTVVENDWAYRANPRNVNYRATLRVGQQRYQTRSLTHYRQARWHKVLWWNDDPRVYARIDADYLQSTGAISRYQTLRPTNGLLSSVRQSIRPMNNGDQSRAMGDTGAQPAIGPLPRWTSTFAVSGDRRAFRWMLADDDAVGSYSFHYRDRATGRPLTITRHPYVTITDIRNARRRSGGYQKDLLPECRDGCDSPYHFDISHHPSIGYVSYLVTGDFYYLEEMQFTASYVELWSNPQYRGFDAGILDGAQSQVRGQAWALRSISDAAFATPDADPMKSYFTGVLRRIMANYDAIYTQSSERSNPLHVIDNYGAVIYPKNGRSRVGIAPWQADFFTWAVGHAAEQGVGKAEALLKWLAKFQIGRLTGQFDNADRGFCWLKASAYSLQIRDSRGAADYADLQQVYAANFPYLSGLACNSSAYINRLNNRSDHDYRRGEMSGYARSPTGFPANLQIGLAMAADSGRDDADRAWQVFAGRSVKPDYRNYPNFAVVPR